MGNYEDKIYSLGEAVTGQTQAMSQAVQKTLENNGGGGVNKRNYNQKPSILSLNKLPLHITRDTFDYFLGQEKGSFGNIFYYEGENKERDHFF